MTAGSPPNARRPARYRFGRFTADETDHTLQADGVPVPIGAVGFRLLLAFLEHAGEVVAKSDLIERLWADAPITDNSLHVQISALRRVIGDETIATKQGRGYRFTPSVERDVLPAVAMPEASLAGNLAEDDYLPRPIGRAEQIRASTRLLGRCHLLTLTGPGGVGKTRLALHVANRNRSRFPDGIWLAELANLKDAGAVFSAVAGNFGCEIADKGDPLEIIGRHLSGKKLLLVLDNCEHVVATAAALCEAIMAKARDARILATSREPLGCAGEQVLEIPPLTLPSEAMNEPEAIRKAAAIELFVERATNADASFRLATKDAVVAARICRRVDGLPLAIEMVAGWAPVLGLDALDARLDASIAGWLRATSVVPLRHSTLRATVEWSLDLLSPAEQVVLRRLGGFAGNFTLGAAEAVAVPEDSARGQAFEVVASLARKSMISVVPGSEPQAYRLSEITRAYMATKLASSEDASATRLRHAHYVLRVVERATHEWELTPDVEWRLRYRPIIDDLRAALEWTSEHAPDVAIMLASSSWHLWQELPLYAEGRRWLVAATALSHVDAEPSPGREASLRWGIAELSVNSRTSKPVLSDLELAVEAYRCTNDSVGLGGTLALSAFVLYALGRFEEAARAISEALPLLDPVRNPRTTAKAYNASMCVLSRLHQPDAAREAGQRALALCERVGAERIALTVQTNLIELALQDSDDLGDVIANGRRIREQLRTRAPSDAQGSTLAILVGALVMGGNLDEALETAREAAPFLANYGRVLLMLDHLALRSAMLGRWMDAALLAGYSDAMHRKSEYPRWPMESRAAERLRPLLHEAMPEDERTRLARIGAQMSEDEALALALGR